MNKKCIVIGGNGFIGKNLVKELLLDGFDVKVFDLSISNIKALIPDSNNRITYIEGDVSNTPYLVNASEDCQQIVWLIHTTVPATSMYDLEFDLQSNIPPLIKFALELIKSNKVNKFVYLSSGGTVYGEPDTILPITEDYKKDPISSYGLTKLVAEEYISFLFKRSNIDAFILRPSNVYGKYQNLQKPQGLIGHILKSVLLKESFNIYGDGSIIRDYIHVKDLARVIINCLNSTKRHNENPLILNVGSGIQKSIKDIINTIEAIIGKPVEYKNLPERSFDCKFNVLDINKLMNTLDWKPIINIEDGLKEVWDWIQSIKSLNIEDE